MHHSTSTAPHFDNHLSIPLALKFLFFAALGAFLIIEHSLALLLIVAFGFAMSLAVQERLRKLDQQETSSFDTARGYWVSDGGSFPSHEVETDRAACNSPRVIDGGSLEHHRR